MSNSILVTKTPKSCSECEYHITDGYKPSDDAVFGTCDLLQRYQDMIYKDFFEKRHPQCPLQDTTELLKALKVIGSNSKREYPNLYNKLIKALGGQNE